MERLRKDSKLYKVTKQLPMNSFQLQSFTGCARNSIHVFFAGCCFCKMIPFRKRDSSFTVMPVKSSALIFYYSVANNEGKENRHASDDYRNRVA